MEQDDRDLLVTLYSPGKRCYKLLMANDEVNKTLLESNSLVLFIFDSIYCIVFIDSDNHNELLEKIKRLGVQPITDNSVNKLSSLAVH